MPQVSPRAGSDAAAVAELSGELVRHARLLHVLKARMAVHVPEGIDLGAVPLLFALYRAGDARRQGEIADATMLDRSTTSRYVTQLVKAGLLGRQCDPDDGRAVQLVLTDRGRQVIEEFVNARIEMINGVLADWDPSDVAILTALMRKLNDEFERLRPGTG